MRTRPVLCKLTVTTCDDALAARLEPGAPSPTRRLEAVRRLSQAGLPVCVLLMPVLPFLEDTEENVLEVVERAAEAGARYIYPVFGMTQRDRQRAWYYQELETRFPGPGPGGEKSPCLWEPVLVCKPPGKTSVGSVFRAVPGAGPPL